MFPVFWVDAFASAVGTGNPAAVVVLDSSPFPPSASCQKLAFELGLAETAFVRRIAGSSYELKWFTPEQEVDLCGHATLATASVLMAGTCAPSTISFDTASGELIVSAVGDNEFELDFPSRPPICVELADTPAALWAGLGIDPADVLYIGKARDFLLVLPSVAAVRAVKPDFTVLASVDALCVIITSRAEEGSPFDVESRVFCPACGVPEDPVTGSAHCTIAPYWSNALEKNTLHCWQASARGGAVNCSMRGERVALRGRASLVFSGKLAESVLV